MTNKIQLQENNTALNEYIVRVNAAKDSASNLPDVEIPVLQSKTVTPTESVQEVKADADYTALEKVTVEAIPSEYIVPNGTKEITENGEHDVAEYAKVNINVASGGGTELEDAFVGGIALEAITEYSNERVTNVRDYIFKDFVNLETVNFPNVQVVGSYGFSGCTKLVEIDFPKCTTIGSYSFASDKALTKANLPILQVVGSYAFSNDAGLFDVNVPLVTTVERQGFYYCTGLEKLDFHLLNTIATYAFTNCRKLASVIIRTTTVCSLQNTNAFNNTLIASGTGYIYVPSALVDSYKTATNWSTYSAQIRAIEDYPEITGG